MKSWVLTSCGAIAVLSTPATAQSTQNSGHAGVEEIIVTAQKREQNLQDVPVAVTALDETALQVNRVTKVQDLSLLAPNVSAIAQGGGVQAPVFTIRGSEGSGTSAGKDRSVSVYLDGVYIGGPVGANFDLPEVVRIEVLRGPQGTLFGRNATAGAISVVTADPKGSLNFRQQVTVGNLNQFRTATTLHTPSFGPFSALISFVHDKYDGDIKNTGAGQVWDLSIAGLGVRKAAKSMGAKNADTYFGAVKFEPSDDFRAVYKFDKMVNHFTTEGVGLAAWTPSSSTNATLRTAVEAAIANGTLVVTGLLRPDYTNNSFNLPSYQETSGHNLNITANFSDEITIKNILSYRKSNMYSFTTYSGLGGLTNGGQPYLFQDTAAAGNHTQWSNEFQVNYESKFVNLTAGGIYFSTKEARSDLPGMRTTASRLTVPGGNFSNVPAPLSGDFVRTHSLAGFAQVEVHVTPQLDVIGGVRVTQDVKKGTNILSGVSLPPYNFSDTRPSWLGGVNFRPTDDVLVYSKYSTGFVSGGKTVDVDYLPETVKSFEFGIKADLFQRVLRANISLFDTRYKNLHFGTVGFSINRSDLGALPITVNSGDLHTWGVEAEATVAPARGLTINSSLGYLNYKTSNIQPFACVAPSCLEFELQRRPKITGQLGAQYISEPLFDESRIMVRIDGNYRTKMNEFSRNPVPDKQLGLKYSPAGWVVNTRLALQDVSLGFGNLEIAAWARNLFNSKRPEFTAQSAERVAFVYERARTYGLDVTFNY